MKPYSSNFQTVNRPFNPTKFNSCSKVTSEVRIFVTRGAKVLT